MNFSKFATTVLVFVLLTTVGAKVSVPNGDVPYTLQSVFVLLSGLIAGANIGQTSQLIYLFFGLFAPVFAGHAYGLSLLSDPTAGFLFSFPIAAFITGYLGHEKKNVLLLVGVCFLAQTVMYLVGTTVLWVNSPYSFEEAVQVGFIRLAPIGYLKAFLTALLYYAYLSIRSIKN